MMEDKELNVYDLIKKVDQNAKKLEEELKRIHREIEDKKVKEEVLSQQAKITKQRIELLKEELNELKTILEEFKSFTDNLNEKIKYFRGKVLNRPLTKYLLISIAGSKKEVLDVLNLLNATTDLITTATVLKEEIVTANEFWEKKGKEFYSEIDEKLTGKFKNLEKLVNQITTLYEKEISQTRESLNREFQELLENIKTSFNSVKETALEEIKQLIREITSQLNLEVEIRNSGKVEKKSLSSILREIYYMLNSLTKIEENGKTIDLIELIERVGNSAIAVSGSVIDVTNEIENLKEEIKTLKYFTFGLLTINAVLLLLLLFRI